MSLFYCGNFECRLHGLLVFTSLDYTCGECDSQLKYGTLINNAENKVKFMAKGYPKD
jgi:hypothetical protein